MGIRTEDYFFVSYSRRDREIVERVTDELARDNLKVWIDSQQIYGGDNWRQAIFNGLRGAAGNEVYNDEPVRDRALKFRARQNVILELGFFYGRLGTDRVLVLQKQPVTFYPPFERPSDLDGRLFEERDTDDGWKNTLREKLMEVGVMD